MRLPIGPLGMAIVAGIFASQPGTSEAGGPFRRRAVVATTTIEGGRNAVAESPMLGTFYPTPAAVVGGDHPTGNGYSPMGIYATSNLVTYGPQSILRSTTAPVTIYSRGYDGVVREQDGYSFSTPFMPTSSPVVYPTADAYYYRPRGTTSSPWETRGNGWIDQN